MYVPDHFGETDNGRIRKLVEENDFATLVSSHPAGLQVSHLPLLLVPQAGDKGALLGHMARANPHWQAWSDRAEVLAIFHGPHGYVSPSWYQPDPVVPTWNYAVVHLHGTARLVHEPAELKALVARLVQRHEAGRTPAWNMALPADDEAKMLAAIVGFEITITRIEAKFKLSQNRSAADREGVVKALEAGGGEAERQLAQLMRDISTDKSS